MTEDRSKQLDQELEQERKELQRSLERTLETEIREAWRMNTAVWLAVTLGAFALNLLILALIAG
jgi:hypothetical protein